MKKRLHTEWKTDLSEQQEDDLIQQALRQKMDADYRKRWQHQLSQRGIERAAPARVMVINRRRYLSLAAAVVVLLAAGWWITGLFNAPASLQLADQYLQETGRQAVQVSMGGGREADVELWQAGRDLYTQKNYKAAAAKIEALAADQSLSVEQSFLLALSYLQDVPPDYDLALQQLSAAEQTNADNGTTTYQAEITWIRALALCKKGDREKAKNILQGIVEEGGWYAEKAANLRQSMEE